MGEMNTKNIKRLMPCLLILFILANLMVQAFVTVLPAIALEFDISAGSVSLVVTMSTIILGVCSVIYGTLSDYIPVKKLLLFGIGMFLFGTLIGLIFQNSFVMIVLARAVQTVGQAAMSSLYLVIASRYFEGREKIRYFAYFTASFQIAQALGVLAGGIIAAYIDWKMLFVISLSSLLFIPAIIRYTPSEQRGEEKHVDFAGISLFSVMIIFMTLLLNQFHPLLLAGEVLAVFAFFLYISKNSNAFITPEFFRRNKKFSMVIFVVFMIYLAQFVFAFLYTFIVNEQFHAMDLVSYILLPGYIGAAIVGGASDKIILKLGKRRTVCLGILLIASSLGLTGIFMESGKLFLSFTAVLFFAGYNTLYSPMVDAVTGALPKNEVGRGIGINDLTINISSSMGIAIGSRLMDSGLFHDFNILPLSDTMIKYGNIMILFAFIAFISLLLYSKFLETNYKEGNEVL